MRERDDTRAPESDTSTGPRNTDGLIDGAHGKHGGGLESEGRPQEEQPHAEPPAERRPAVDDRSGHAAERRDRTPPPR